MFLLPLFLSLAVHAQNASGQVPQSRTSDQNASIWNSSNSSKAGPELVVQAGHTKTIYAMAFSPDGGWLATGSADLTIKIWDLSSGAVLRTIPSSVVPIALAISPDSRVIASGAGAVGGNGMLGQAGVYEVVLWDVSTGKKMRILGSHVFSVKDLAFSSDGKTLTSASGDAIQVWNVQTGQIIHSTILEYGSYKGGLPRLPWPSAGSKGQFNEFFAASAQVTVSPNGKVAAIGGLNQSFKIYDALTGSVLSDSKVKAEFDTSVAFSPDGALVAFSQRTHTVVKSSGGGADLHIFDTGTAAKIGMSMARFSADGRKLLTSRQSSPGFTTCEIASGKCVHVGSVTRGSVLASFSPDGRLIGNVFGSEVTLTNTLSGQDERVLSSREQISMEDTDAFSVDVSDARKMKAAKKLGLNTPEEMKAYAESHRKESEQGLSIIEQYKQDTVAFTPDGRWLVDRRKLFRDSTIENVWSTATGTPVHKFDPAIFKSVGIPGLSPDGRYKAAAGYPESSGKALFGFHQTNPNKDPYLYSQQVDLFDALSGNKVRTFKLGRTDERSFVPIIGFSTESDLVAMTGFNSTHEGVIFVYEIASGSKVAELKPNQNVFALRCITIRSKGSVIALAYESHVDLINVATGRLLWRAEESQGVRSVTFTPDGRSLAVLDAAGNREIHDAASGQNLATLVNLAGPLGASGNEWLVVAPDGLFDGSPASFRHILWRFSGDTFDVAPVELFFNEFYYPGLLSDILRGKHPKATQDISQKDRRQPHLTLKLAGPDVANKSQSVSERIVNLEIGIADAPAGARDVRLFRNGSLVKAWHGDVLKQSSTMLLTAAVPIVAGPNNFSAYGFNNDNIKSSDASLSLLGAESLRTPSTAYVLAIGINAYQNSAYDLKYATSDARSFSEAVQREQTKLGKFSRVKVIQLLDKDATKANILSALGRLSGGGKDAVGPNFLQIQELKQAQPEDAVIVYYAGHGTAKQARFYLVPHDLGYTGSRSDLNEVGINTILEHSISDQELATALEGVDAGQLLLVIDACNSGQALEAEEKRRGPMNSKGLAQLAYEKGIDILAAAQSYQAAMEAQQLGHGYLTYALVEEGLNTPAADTSPRDGQVDVREWLDYATERVPQMQEALIRQSQKQGRELSFAEEDEPEHTERGVQRPRVFYRRETQYPLFVVSKLPASASDK